MICNPIYIVHPNTWAHARSTCDPIYDYNTYGTCICQINVLGTLSMGSQLRNTVRVQL